ncbi:MAG: tyrosine-type recombinase/integrase [Nitrososphaerales archaeon]
MSDIHGYSKRLEQALKRVRVSEKIAEEDKKLEERFSIVLRTQRISLGRVAKYVSHLKIVAETLPLLTNSDRGLHSASKEDIELLSIHINELETYGPHTKSDYVTVLKRFYQWVKAPPEEYNHLRRKHRYHPEVDDLNSGMKMNQRFLPSDLLGDDEVNLMIQTAEWIMVKGAVALVDEVGPRPGEFLNMKVKDILFQDKDDRVICRSAHNGGGKTGERLILIIKSVSLVAAWLNAHPFKDDPEAPLWIGFSSTNRYEQWSYRAFKNMFEDLAKKAGIKSKKVIPYLFRHSAATRDARLGFTESQLCMKYGWVLGSKIPRVYLHLANTDLYEKIAETNVGKPSKKPEPQTLTCARAKMDNLVDNGKASEIYPPFTLFSSTLPCDSSSELRYHLVRLLLTFLLPNFVKSFSG